MLKLVWMARAACQKDLWSDFDPNRQVWIVSDSKTKFFLNQSLLQRTEIINEPVKRAKEFWKELLRQTQPDFKVLEDLGTRIAARDFLKNNGTSEWCKRPGAPNKLIDACKNLAPLMVHEGAAEILDQIETEFKNTSVQFLEMSRLAARFYLDCIGRTSAGVPVAPHFLVPYLLSRTDVVPKIEKEIIFDVGFDLREGEKELIQKLSKTVNVTVLIPAKDPSDLASKGLGVYRNFDLGLTHVTHVVPEKADSQPTSLKVWRCSSPEAEARQAVEQIRNWIKGGIDPESICVTSIKISDYEDILAHDLAWEGIGFQRTLKTPLSASRIFRALAARLRIMEGEISGRILEEGFLSVASYGHSLRRRNERREINPVVEVEQVPHLELKSSLEKLRSHKFLGSQNIQKFRKVLINIFSDLIKEKISISEVYQNLFLKGLQRLQYEVGDRELDFSQWVAAWQEVTSQLKVSSQNSGNGVWGVDLSSCEESPAEHIIVLGCVQSRKENSVINGLDREKLVFFNQLGFDLDPPARNESDSRVEWLSTGHRKNIILSCAKTDSSGKSIAASPLWIKVAATEKRDLDFINTAQEIQWAYVQKQILKEPVSSQVDSFKAWNPGNTLRIGERLLADTGQTRPIILGAQSAKPLISSLSASQIEAYWECPYKFFARSHLKLFDLQDMELEPTPLARGQWTHSAVEKIMKERSLSDWTDETLGDLIDNLEDTKIQRQLSKDIWPNIRSRFLRQLRRFIDFEIQWRSRYSQTQPKYFEAKLDGFLSWDEEEGSLEFVKTSPESVEKFWVPFSGRVDRIDITNDGRAIILDYKSSGGAADNIPSWVSNGSFQLALYSQGIEAGFLEGQNTPVIAAQYFVLKRLDREKGFRILSENGTSHLPQEKTKAAVSEEKRNQYFSEIKGEVHKILETVRQGIMTPHPREEAICQKCNWRQACRAEHLN